ncbi:MAG TPA: MFS transporter [Pseudoflavonifractor sp.]|nr:MFS transporter [Pseudoflavonifractor sp.]
MLLINVAYWVAAGVYSPFLSAYFTSKGLSASEIGILLAVQPVMSILVQPVWAYLSDRSGRRKLFLMLVTAGAAAASLLYYSGTGFPALLGATAAFALFFSAILPLCDAVVIEGAARFHLDFAKIRMGGTLGFALVVLAAGFCLERYPEWEFLLVCTAVLLLLFFESRFPEEPQAAREPAMQEGERARGRVFESREAFFVLAFAFVCQFGLSFSGAFLGGYVVELGYSRSLVGILSGISALSEVPILLFAARLTRRFGEIPILIFSSAAMALRIFLLGIGTIPTMFLGQLMQSVTYMTVYFCCATYISRHVLPGKQSQGQSLLAAVQTGLAAVLANIGGGFVAGWLGMRSAYMAVAAFTLAGSAAVTLAYRLYRRRRAPTVSSR